MNPKEPSDPQKPSCSFSLPLPLKPPRHIPKPPHHLDPPTPVLQGFCRAVRRPPAKQSPPGSLASSSQGQVLSTASSVCLLGKLCEATGVGPPLYEMYYSHTGQDGLMYFNYRVSISGVAAAFKGLVSVLLGSRTSNALEEARQAAAQQVLQRVYKKELDH